MNSIQALNRSMDSYDRAASNLLRATQGLGSPSDPSLRGIEEPGSGAETSADGRQAGPGTSEDLIPAMADLLVARVGVRGSLALVKSEDEMLGTLLDIIV